jgi:hypothetical protein
MGLMGTLDAMALGDLLQWAGTARKNGVLTVSQGKARVQLAVGGARILGVYSNEPPLLLGQFLLSHGMIDEATLNDALVRQDETREHLATVLTEMGAITTEELERYIILKAEETIFGMLDWTEAMFEFDANAKTDPRMIQMDRGIDDLIVRGAQRREEMVQMRTVLGDPGVVLCRTNADLPEQVCNSPMAARIYEAIDGHRTLTDILLYSRASEYFATKFLHELICANVVRVKDIQEARPEPGNVRAVMEAATQLIHERQFDGAVSLLTAAWKVFPENTELKQILAKAEAGFLEYAYQNRLSADSIPRLAIPIDAATSREDISSNERFILDLARAARWSVKAMTRISPLHEVDVVRATLNLINKGLLETFVVEEPVDEPQMMSLDHELLAFTREDDAANIDVALNTALKTPE